MKCLTTPLSYAGLPPVAAAPHQGLALAPGSPVPAGCPCWKAAALPLPCKPAVPPHIGPCCNTEPPEGTGSQPSGIPSVPCSLGQRHVSGGVRSKVEEGGGLVLGWRTKALHHPSLGSTHFKSWGGMHEPTAVIPLAT